MTIQRSTSATATTASVRWDVDPDSLTDQNSAAGVQRIRHSTNNFLANASFEHWLDGTSVAPNGWTLGGDATVARTAVSPTIGTYAASLSFGTANTGELYTVVGVSHFVDYTFSGYFERTAGTGAARLVAQDANSPYAEFASTNLSTGAGQRLAVLTVKPPADGSMRFSIKSGNTTASTWRIDELMMQESKGVATTFQACMLNDTDAQVVYGQKTLIAPTIINGYVWNDVTVLADAATVATDASKGPYFRLTMAADRTLGVPTNPKDGQTCTWEVVASGANRTLTLTTGSAGAFKFGTTVTGLTATTSGLRDLITATYSGSLSRWMVRTVEKGF